MLKPCKASQNPLLGRFWQNPDYQSPTLACRKSYAPQRPSAKGMRNDCCHTRVAAALAA